MLKWLCSTAMLLLFSLPLFPQVHRAYTRPEPVTEFLLKGGWQYTTFTSSANEASFGSGWHAGVALNVPILKLPFRKAPLSGVWRLQPELMYSKRSAVLQYPGSAGSSAYEVAYSFSYVTYPILLAYRPNDIFEIQAGPQFGVLFGNKVEAPANRGVANINPADLNKWEWGFAAGVEFNVSPLAIGLRYTQNLNELPSTAAAKQQLERARLHGIQLYGALVF